MWIWTPGMVPLHICQTIRADVGFYFTPILSIRNFNFPGHTNKTLILWLCRFIFSAKSTPAAFSYTVWCHYIIISTNCTPNFIAFYLPA